MPASPTARPIAALAAVAVVAVVLGLATASPSLVLVAPAAVVWAGHGVAVARDRRRVRLRRAATVAGVERLIQHLRTGGSLGPAVRAGLGPPSGRSGAGPPEDRLVSATLRILMERGGPALSSLERLSDTLRSADALREEARVQAAQATASATALALLPLVFATVLMAVDARLRSFYLHRPAGTACLLAAVTLGHGSWWLMQRLIGDDR